VRQENLKTLVAQADARWAAKQSYLDAPRRQPLPSLEVKEPGGNAKVMEPQEKQGAMSAVDGALQNRVQEQERAAGQAVEVGAECEGPIQVPDGVRHHFAKGAGNNRSTQAKEKKEKEDPWKKARGGPSQEYQPETWGSIATPRW
jgi:NADH dehydrogenase [ubiquinone] 1 alpha subcomplex assembly factor 2